MLMRIVMQVRGQIMAQFTRLYLSVTTLLLSSAKKLRALITQAYQSVVNLLRQLNPPAPTLPSLKSGKPAGKTKSARSRSKGSKTAQTRTAAQSTQDGLKLQGLVKQHLQHASKASKKGK